MSVKRKKQERKTAKKSLASILSFPESCMPAVPYMELQGDVSLALSGYESLLLYDETNILFRMKPGAGADRDFTLLRITGEGLTICVLQAGRLCVRGKICSVILHSDGYQAF